MKHSFRTLSILLALAIQAWLPAYRLSADTLLLEAESFDQHGGWSLDTQFIDTMGSPYLLAHGLGRPVKDTSTTFQVRQGGLHTVWVRTRDWVAPWKAEGSPGRFQVLLDGKALGTEFGTRGAEWHWENGGKVQLSAGKHTLALHDLTGFDGRCDAVVLSSDPAFVPDNAQEVLPAWRRALLGLPIEPEVMGPYDLVVVGGGYAGIASAISAARNGLKVALVQNRPVLGGNGSSEIRVWAMGGTRRGPYPNLGEIVEEFMDKATLSPGTYEEFGDEKKEELVRAEKNISLFLNHHVFAASKDGSRLKSVSALNTRTSQVRRFEGALFVDCTGHGSLGAMVNADHTLQEEGHLGMSNMWRWQEADGPRTFPKTPWALALGMDDFPYPKRFHGQWFWESGFDKHPIHDLELVRDWNLRAVFGAFNAMKNGDGAEEHRNAELIWVAYVGGTRESRQLLGDVILTREDIVAKREFEDGCVPTTWDIDLHYPREDYAEKFPDNPFISKAVFDKSVDRKHGYPVPYRCFYSRNVENLFMAGRCVSVTHEALGTVRVMKTGGMMGEVVGKAAAICMEQNCLPRDVYHSYLPVLQERMKMRGAARRNSLKDAFFIPENAPVFLPVGVEYLDPAAMAGLVLDDTQAKKTGAWKEGEGLKGYVGQHYLYHGGSPKAEVRFEFKVDSDGTYEVRSAHQPHENRSSKTPMTVASEKGSTTVRVNQKVAGNLEHGFVSLGRYAFKAGKAYSVTIANDGVDGNVHVDAIQVLKVD